MRTLEIKDYVVVSVNNLWRFEKRVNEYLKEGCKLVGGLSIDDSWFCQALIKKYVCKERISNEKIK